MKKEPFEALLKCVSKVRFSGTLPKENFYIILEQVDQLKKSGYDMMSHERLDLEDNIVKFKYTLSFFVRNEKYVFNPNK